MEQSARDRLLEMIEDGLVDRDYVIMAFVKWSTNDDVKEMCHANEIPLWEEEDEGCDECGAITKETDCMCDSYSELY